MLLGTTPVTPLIFTVLFINVYVYSPVKATLHARHTETDRNRQ